MPDNRSQSKELEQPIEDIERYLYLKGRIKFFHIKYDLLDPNIPFSEPEPIMAERPQNNLLKYYVVQSQVEPHNNIVAPAINQNDFVLKPLLLSVVQQNQFSGSPTNDPNLNLSVKANGVSQEAIRLRLFHFSLRDRARAWLQYLPSNSVTRWDELKKVFLARYFPPSETAMLRAQINGFKQKDNESFFDAWERYKDMMQICLHHGLENWMIIHTFYNGLLYNTKMNLSAAAGGSLMDKPYDEAYELVENMAQNHFQWGGERDAVEKSTPKSGMYEVNNIDRVNAKVDALTQKIESLTITPATTVAAITPNSELCGTPGHTNVDCQLLVGVPTNQINYAQGNPYSNTYNHGWRNHMNFSYKSNNVLFSPNPTPTIPPGYQKGAPVASQAPRKSNLEIMMENFMNDQAKQNKKFANQNAYTSEMMKQLLNKFDAMATNNKMLAAQISQVAQQQAAIEAPIGAFSGQSQSNPKGHANAITLRSGTKLDEPIDPRIQNLAMCQNSGKGTEKVNEPTNDGNKDENGKEKDKEPPYVPPPPYKPLITYPQRLVKSKNEGQFKKFVEVLKQLNMLTA
ncbi:uncharacterized protein LOC127130652 [Lathyrus oleraceus]|uniref:uncharacterized protein LOC127130652 n=1 Tax=Pisum sativum TaxID=3888 RepID=UPI0021CFE8DC|nr:uncharacterized protein LOC127130652 [Pisum sativum]